MCTRLVIVVTIIIIWYQLTMNVLYVMRRTYTTHVQKSRSVRVSVFKLLI